MKAPRWLGIVGWSLMAIGLFMLSIPDDYGAINANWPEEPAPRAGSSPIEWATFGVGVAFVLFRAWLDWQAKKRADRAEQREIHDRRRRDDDLR